MVKRNAKAREVDNYGDCKAPGDFYFLRSRLDVTIGMVHTCPCGCGLLGSLYWDHPRAGGANWTVTGKWPKVTLNPSIGFKGGHDSPVGPDGYHWHGYLRDGVFEEC